MSERIKKNSEVQRVISKALQSLSKNLSEVGTIVQLQTH